MYTIHLQNNSQVNWILACYTQDSVPLSQNKLSEGHTVHNGVAYRFFSVVTKRLWLYWYAAVVKETVSEDFMEFFGPQMALAYRLDAISQGPKYSQIPEPKPPHTSPRNGYAHIQNIMHGAV